MDLEDIINKYPPRQMMIIPIAIVGLALIILGANFLTTGSPVDLGVEFTGGALVTVPAVGSEESVAEKVADYPLQDIRKIGNRYQLEFGPMSDDEQTALSSLLNTEFGDAQISYAGPVYSQALQSEALTYVPISFILMALVIFILFRQPFVSLIVVLCAMADILTAAALMNIVGVSLSLGTVAALLMLIGYSVDTDILLSMRVLKRKGPVDDKIIGAMGTGLLMTTTTIGAVASLFVASNLLYHLVPSFTRMDIIADISTVLFFGLLADIFNTWVTNAQALRWYINRDKKAARRSGR